MNRRRVLGPVLGVAMALASTLVVSACGLSGDGVQVGSTNFSESQILANLFAESMEYSGIPSQVKELTTTEVVEPALERNQLQVMPGYLATFTEYLNAKKNGPSAPPVSGNNVAATLAVGQCCGTDNPQPGSGARPERVRRYPRVRGSQQPEDAVPTRGLLADQQRDSGGRPGLPHSAVLRAGP